MRICIGNWCYLLRPGRSLATIVPDCSQVSNAAMRLSLHRRPTVQQKSRSVLPLGA